jgi:hypothetical protein
MKRDFELIRTILREVEDVPGLVALTGFTYPRYDENIVTEHMEILIEAGLLRGKVSRYLNSGGHTHVSGLMWAGHDFLESMKDEGIWMSVLPPIKRTRVGREFGMVS